MSKVRKMNIGGEEYSFKVTNRTVLELDDTYGNAGSVFEGILNAKKYSTNAIKLLSCSCVEKKWEFDELVETITGEELYLGATGVVMNLILDYIGINKTEDKEKN